MTNVSTIGAMYVHNDWARSRILDAAAPLPDEELDKPLGMGPGSLRATLHHLWGAERIWLDRWLGRADARFDDTARRAPIDDLRVRFENTARERNAFVTPLDADTVTTTVAFTAADGDRFQYALGDLLIHVANHGAHHRAQVVNMLRSLGVEPPKLDYLVLRIESPDEPAVSFDPDVLRELHRYDDWATERVLDAAGSMDDGALDRTFDMGLGSLRRTLQHMRNAEQWWLDHWTSNTPSEKTPRMISIDGLRTLFGETAAARNAFLDSETPEGLERFVTAEPASGRVLRFRVGDIMIQLSGHGTYHRAQALNMLRNLGADLPELDYLDLCEERVGRT